MRSNKNDQSENVWLFTYGSLFWDCEFGYKERQFGFVHGFQRRYNWIDNHCRGIPGIYKMNKNDENWHITIILNILVIVIKHIVLIKGSEGRIVTLCNVPSDASKEDLIKYQKISPSEENKLDNVCCWGKAYKFKRSKWQGGIKEKLIKRYPDGFKEVKTTFYPMVRLISIRFYSLKPYKK